MKTVFTAKIENNIINLLCLPGYTLNEVLRNTKDVQDADKAKYTTLTATLYAHALKLNEDKACNTISFLKEFRAVIFYIMPHFNQDKIFTRLDLFDAMNAYYRYRSAQPVLNALNEKPRKYFLSQETAIANIHN